MTIPAPAALARLAVHSLQPIGDPLRVDSFDRLLLEARRERVVVPLARAVAAGAVSGVEPAWVDELRREELRATGVTMACHAAAVRVLDVLHDLDVVVVKGCATAFLDHPRPVDRYTSDVDLLVSPSDTDLAVERLGTAPVPGYRDGWARRYGHAATVVGDDGVEIDLHRRLVAGFVGLAVPPAVLFESTEPFELAGTPARAFDGPGRLLHAAVSADSFDRPSMHSALDVAQLVFGRRVDWREAVERAERWGIDAFFAAGVARCWRRFDLGDHDLVDWATAHRPGTTRQRLAMSMAGERPRGHRLAAPLALPVREWPRYVAPVLVPSRRYAATNDRGIASRVRLLRSELGRRAAG